MRVLIAIDAFKGSLTSVEAGEAVRRGILRAAPSVRARVFPLADGGEGTMDALSQALGARPGKTWVTGPLGSPVSCTWGQAGDLAIAEAAQAAGLTLVPEAERSPLRATTRGLGELLLHAFRQGCRRFLVGLGGTATNDGGAGMLQALGFDLLDREGRPIGPGALGLRELAVIAGDRVPPALLTCDFQVACDVRNPLLGPRGATMVYGPQKGAAEPRELERMEACMKHYSACAARFFPEADPDYPGSGAAGGLGFAFRTFLPHARLVPGSRLVLRALGLEEQIRQADLVVTGEGCLDGQTAMGKAPGEIAALARSLGRPVLAFAGALGPGAEKNHEGGMDALFPIAPGPLSLQEAMEPGRAAENLERTAFEVFRLLNRCGNLSSGNPRESMI